MTCFYQVVKTTYPNNKKYPEEYGIVATAEEYGSTVVLSSVYRVCANFEEITRLADLCNRLELDPIHLTDVVEDFLAEL